MSDPTDQDLLTAAQRGDHDATRQLYQRYASFVYHWLARRVDRIEDAEDLTSDIMIRMVEAMPTLQPKNSFKSWLFGVAHHVLADHWRRTYRLPESALTPEVIGSEADTESIGMDDGALRAKAEEVLSQLPDQYRQVLQCRFFECQTLAETAQVLKTTVGNVKVLQYRALKKAAELSSRV